MKATGIIRRIDDLGRIVIPKEIRRSLHIREGDPLELFVDVGSVTFKKYSFIDGLTDVSVQYLNALYKVLKKPVIICDTDFVIASSPISRPSFKGCRVSDAVNKLTNSYDIPYTRKELQEPPLYPLSGGDWIANVVIPVRAYGELCGSVILLAKDENEIPTETEVKMLQAAAAFLEANLDC